MTENQEIALTVAIGVMKRAWYTAMADDLFELRRQAAILQAAARDAPSADAVDAQRGKCALEYLESEGWTVQGIDRQIAIDKAIAASAPKESK